MSNDLISRKSLLSLYDGLEEKGLVIPIDVFIQNIKDEPTSYDVDGVVERLKSLETYTQSIIMDKHPFCASEIETISKKKAIEIVKGGAKCNQ